MRISPHLTWRLGLAAGRTPGWEIGEPGLPQPRRLPTPKFVALVSYSSALASRDESRLHRKPVVARSSLLALRTRHVVRVQGIPISFLGVRDEVTVGAVDLDHGRTHEAGKLEEVDPAAIDSAA
jgi:hypothetical protein